MSLATATPRRLFSSALLVTALAGMPSIDAKLRRRDPATWQGLTAMTSIVPFVAIARGRNRFVQNEFGWLTRTIAVVAWRCAVGASVAVRRGSGRSVTAGGKQSGGRQTGARLEALARLPCRGHAAVYRRSEDHSAGRWHSANCYAALTSATNLFTSLDSSSACLETSEAAVKT